jgi:hypothetical protein
VLDVRDDPGGSVDSPEDPNRVEVLLNEEMGAADGLRDATDRERGAEKESGCASASEEPQRSGVAGRLAQARSRIEMRSVKGRLVFISFPGQILFRFK